MSGIDFEAEGLLDNLTGEARGERVALLNDLADAGVPLEELRRAVEENRLVLLPVERVFESGAERYTAEEIADLAGLGHGFLVRLLQALGAPIPDEDDRVHGEADLEAARRARMFLDAGLPEDGVLETSRIIGISMSNLADANRDMVGEVFTEPGISERELALRYAAAAQTMLPLLGETLLHAYRIHLRETISQAVITESELAEGRLSGSDEVTIAFADLVGFTRLGELLDIEAIGELTGRLFELASDAARPPVRLVKMIGDAAMFASRDATPLLEAVLGLVEAAGTDAIPSLRAGVATGQALGRGGDWYGRPVNLAARITGFARPDSVVVSQAVRDSVDAPDRARFSFSFAGKRHFKGIRGEVAVHRVRRSEDRQ
ncbi:MAG TPA: adenylate cyclase regulatory domain-containing protein [Solirubrobacterales bacterium]|nr:adenylate cyclase regulatory domain-containing protein [Solirubrobacterales bacterium]HEU4980296.1 adenylate cyclase regulatory domain-containing protein [Solirubrobacterales bacterium]